jgi:2-iminobutanoate/2-iminopropanoate deaminase
MASIEIVTAPGAPRPRGPYAPAVLSTGARTLTISGALAEGPDGNAAHWDVYEQAKLCLRNIDALLVAAGATRTDVVRIGVYLVDMADRPAVARARVEYFGDHTPAATLVQVAALVTPEFKVEIEATAVW